MSKGYFSGEIMSVTKEEIFVYARHYKLEKPSASAEELRSILQARFIEGRDVLKEAAARGVTVGAIANPVDWIRGIALMLSGIAKLWQDQPDMTGIKDMIDGVVVIVSEEKQ